MRVLFDTNVLLDAILEREPFVSDAAFLLEIVDAGKLEGFVSATTVTDIYYLVRKQTRSAAIALAAVTALIASMTVCSVGREILEQAVTSSGSDFEDSVQIACATSLGLEAIATRDTSGFSSSPAPVLSPTELKTLVLRDIES